MRCVLPVCDKHRVKNADLHGDEVNIVVKCFNGFSIPKL